jgi:hypothetical protein
VKIERIKSIYTELATYVVQLDSDPRARGPAYLQDTIARTRNFLNAVSRLQLEVHQEKQYVARELRMFETAYQASFDDMLSNDERVRRLPSIEDRKATVAVFLRSERQRIDNLKAELQDIEFVEKAIRHQHKELSSTMSEIKLQRSLIRDEIDTGAMYGDERIAGDGPGGRGPVGSDTEFDTDELARILDESGEPQVDLAVPEPKPEPPPQPVQAAPQPVVEQPQPEPQPVVVASQPTDEDAAIQAFLGAGAAKQSDVPSEEEYDDLFARI